MFHLLVRLCAAAVVNAALPSIALVVLALVLMSLRGWSAATRYFVWCVTLVLVVLLPFLGMLQPASKPQTALPSPVHIVLAPHTVVPGHSPRVHPNPAALSPTVLLDVVGALWCCAALFASLRFGNALLAAMRLKRGSQPCTDPGANGLLSDLRVARNVRRPVSLATSEVASAPMLIGYANPVIILPVSLLPSLHREELLQILSHELAHLARFDDWAIAAERFLRSVFTLNPLIHFICWRLSLERELACDDRVLTSSEPVEYAACLTKIAELVHSERSITLALPLLTRKSQLFKRVETMLDRTRSHAPRLSTARAFGFSVLAVGLSVLGTRVPALLASPLAEDPANDIGPIVLTAPDGSASAFVDNGSETYHESAFPNGTIVFKKDGRSYVIRDRSVLQAAQKLMEPMKDLSKRQSEFGQDQKHFGEQQKLLAERVQMEVDKNVRESMKGAEEQLRIAEDVLRTHEPELAAKAAIDAQKQILDMQPQLAAMRRQIAAAAESKFAAEQGELGRQMGEFGAMQGRLAQQQARDAQRIERELKSLIKRAQGKGLAQPLQ